MKTKLILAFVFISFFTASNYAQTSDPIKLILNVTADDEFKSEVVSYIGREIRSLKDVEIVQSNESDESNADYHLSIIAIKGKSKNGNVIGYSLSAAITEVRSLENEKRRVEILCSNKEWQGTLASLLSYKVLEYHQLFVGEINELRSLCSDVVTSVDGKVFEVRRKVARWYREAMKKRMDAAPVSRKRKIQ